MQSDKKVQILMSTYNGERYLAEQLDSIFRQTWPNIEVLVRDDGSKDATLEILNEYQKKHANLYVFPGTNEGLTRSFLELIQKCDADYVAFSDQDDYWLENKIEVAVERLAEFDGPALYCSNQILVDQDLNRLPEGEIPDAVPGFGNALNKISNYLFIFLYKISSYFFIFAFKILIIFFYFFLCRVGIAKQGYASRI